MKNIESWTKEYDEYKLKLEDSQQIKILFDPVKQEGL